MVSNKDFKFHHYGLAVKNFRDSVSFHKNLGYVCSDIIFDNIQNVNIVLCTSDLLPTVELVKPIDKKSPIINYLKKNNEIIYHVCYELDTKKIMIKDFFYNQRFLCVSKPKPARLFDNRLVSFYYLKNIGLIEILEK